MREGEGQGREYLEGREEREEGREGGEGGAVKGVRGREEREGVPICSSHSRSSLEWGAGSAL